VPQNASLACRPIFSPRVLNEFKFGYNGAKTRINGQAPTVNGLDLSAITLNISGNTANFNLPGQGTARAPRRRADSCAPTPRRTGAASPTRPTRSRSSTT
jgi:hypothetical protein